ncbi:MAG: hypothetical protein LBD32_02735 [Cytophagales bacterium]|jgi:hypothetical protein|nr:hypothetical protein [Cytophagales bacterium]
MDDDKLKSALEAAINRQNKPALEAKLERDEIERDELEAEIAKRLLLH